MADMYCCGEPRHALLTASGDGTLAHLDLRASKVIARSDNQEDELLSGACCAAARDCTPPRAAPVTKHGSRHPPLGAALGTSIYA